MARGAYVASLVFGLASRPDSTPRPQAPAGATPSVQDPIRFAPDRVEYPSEGEERRLRAIERGLHWLSTRQSSRDGSVEVGDADRGQRAPLAVTSLAALAWMAGGSSPHRGTHQLSVERAIEYLLANVHRKADPYPGYIEDRDEAVSKTHGHGLASLALAQAYTSSPNSPLGGRIRTALIAAVERIEISQGEEGGWEYQPYRTTQHEGSVTVALVQALRAAKDVGLHVDPDVIAKAVDYVKRSQVMDNSRPGAARAKLELGGFRYRLEDPRTSIALTAAGLATLQAAGEYDGQRIEEGYAYVWRELLARDDEPESNEAAFPYYERFYLSQALWHQREQLRYRNWAEPIMRHLIESQQTSGKWEYERYVRGQRTTGHYGAAYATACNVLFLALPDDSLPLFHR